MTAGPAGACRGGSPGWIAPGCMAPGTAVNVVMTVRLPVAYLPGLMIQPTVAAEDAVVMTLTGEPPDVS